MELIFERKIGEAAYQIMKEKGGFSVYRQHGEESVKVCGSHSEADARKIIGRIADRLEGN